MERGCLEHSQSKVPVKHQEDAQQTAGDAAPNIGREIRMRSYLSSSAKCSYAICPALLSIRHYRPGIRYRLQNIKSAKIQIS